ncbi:mitochondrial 54S ribosomal protein uL30m [Lipomyces oligophaga]|uniref:mitochondrial 54S ribosomal protein uL30m n=1 Tax=Lipomyces oligophaga TaxID=45792 RepID=UPI0034CE5E55
MGAFKITQIRSGIGLPRKINGSLQALGLGYRGSIMYHDINPQIAGHLMRVKELVEVAVVDRKLTREEHNSLQKSNKGYFVEDSS